MNLQPNFLFGTADGRWKSAVSCQHAVWHVHVYSFKRMQENSDKKKLEVRVCPGLFVTLI